MSTLSLWPWRELKVTGLLELLMMETREQEVSKKTENKIIRNFSMWFPKLYSAFFYDHQCFEQSLEKHLAGLIHHLNFEFPRQALMIFL